MPEDVPEPIGPTLTQLLDDTLRPLFGDNLAAYHAEVERHDAEKYDFTDAATTDASRAEAERLGLGKYFDEHSGWTGTISIVDGSTKEVAASIHGSRDFAEYRAAIDAALQNARR